MWVSLTQLNVSFSQVLEAVQKPKRSTTAYADYSDQKNVAAFSLVSVICDGLLLPHRVFRELKKTIPKV